MTNGKKIFFQTNFYNETGSEISFFPTGWFDNVSSDIPHRKLHGSQHSMYIKTLKPDYTTWQPERIITWHPLTAIWDFSLSVKPVQSDKVNWYEKKSCHILLTKFLLLTRFIMTFANNINKAQFLWGVIFFTKKNVRWKQKSDFKRTAKSLILHAIENV